MEHGKVAVIHKSYITKREPILLRTKIIAMITTGILISFYSSAAIAYCQKYEARFCACKADLDVQSCSSDNQDPDNFKCSEGVCDTPVATCEDDPLNSQIFGCSLEAEVPHTLRWLPQNPCVTYHLNDAGYANMETSLLKETIRKSFANWSNIDCSWINFKEGDDTPEKTVGRNPTGDNHNTIIFEETWSLPPERVAFTTITIDAVKGYIRDFDIQLNTVDFEFSTEDPTPVKIEGGKNIVDLESVLTHEIGHALGLTHTSDVDAVMYYVLNEGQIKRPLLQDDKDGLCKLYPAAEEGLGACTEYLAGIPDGEDDYLDPDDDDDSLPSGSSYGMDGGGVGCEIISVMDIDPFDCWPLLGFLALACYIGVKREKE